MLKTFIFYEVKNKWVEENSHLLYHDLCAFVDEDIKVIYLWNGPRSTKKRLNKGIESINKLINNYSGINFRIENLNKKKPSQVEARLNNLLEAEKNKDDVVNYQYSHFLTIRLHFFSSIISLILPIMAILALSSSLLWESVGSNYFVNSNNYNNWLLLGKIPIFISLIIFAFILAIAFYEYEITVILFSSISIIICISLLLYLGQGIFLFQFQEGYTSVLYYIAKSDIYIFLFIIGFTIAIFEIPNFMNTIHFLSTYKKFIF